MRRLIKSALRQNIYLVKTNQVQDKTNHTEMKNKKNFPLKTNGFFPFTIKANPLRVCFSRDKLAAMTLLACFS